MSTSTPPAGGTDDPSSYRLPTTVLPRHYRLTLVPDLAGATFTGEVAIDVTIAAATSTVVLNAAELVIDSATLAAADGGAAPVPASVTLDADEEQAVLSFPEPLAVGTATLHLAFTGILNDKLRGFYRSTFTDESGVERVIATTQMESTDARRAFPCFDEPEFKATFEITLVVDDALAAYSNYPVVEETPEPGGRRRVHFAPTMVMSTYLVAFVVGPLEHTDPVDVDGVPLRVVHPLGKGHLTAFALEVGAHALRFFAGYFGIPYPGEKLDMVAIPDFAAGAMENLGCVTYRESLLLVDPATAARVELERIADVICHEIAHMWFGDLVTMKWWNGIWLNEAFATFMEVLAVDAYRPEWERWVSFGVEREAAMAVDGLHATRPVEFPVGRPEEAEGMFDVLTYQKGGSVLRMLEQFIGPDVFREGIHDYLVTHAYDNTETRDLWDALEGSSGRPVSRIMDTWINQGGYPLLTVGPGGSVAQQPFCYSGEPGGAIGSRWQIPILYRSLDGASDWADSGLLTAARGTVDDPEDGELLVNAGGSGYYRVAYDTDTVGRLASRLGELTPLERYNLVSDTWAATLAGHARAADLLRLARALADSGEGDPSVWSVVIGAIGLFDRIVPESGRPTLAAGVRSLLGPLAAKLGWDPSATDDERTPSLRAGVLSVLGTVGDDPEVRAEAARRFTDADRVPLHGDTATAILSIVADHGGPDEYEAFLAHYRSPATPQEENRYRDALAGFGDAALAARTFDLAMTEVRSQDAPFLIRLMLWNRQTGPATWQRVAASWDTFPAKFPSSTLPRMLDGVRGLCTPPELAAEVTAFVEAHPLQAGGRTVEQILERLAMSVAFATREGAGLATTVSDVLGVAG
ncbi:MAG: M1 family metallopeptidase [Acidimicrobiales bacterium]|jgi:puromycin-sensitive aminopeptidase